MFLDAKTDCNGTDIDVLSQIWRSLPPHKLKIICGYQWYCWDHLLTPLSFRINLSVTFISIWILNKNLYSWSLEIRNNSVIQLQGWSIKHLIIYYTGCTSILRTRIFFKNIERVLFRIIYDIWSWNFANLLYSPVLKKSHVASRFRVFLVKRQAYVSSSVNITTSGVNNTQFSWFLV